MEKRLYAIGEAIKTDKTTRDSLMQFWNLFPKKFDSTIDISTLKTLFCSIVGVFWQNVPEQVVSDFINEQIELRLLVQNQGIADTQTEVLASHESPNTPKAYIHNERDVQQFQPTPVLFSSVNLEIFLNLLVDFYLMLTLNPMVETAAEFFEFVFARITRVDNDVIKTKLHPTNLKKAGSNFNFVFLSVQTERDPHLAGRVRAKDVNVTLAKEEIKNIGKDAQEYLNQQIHDNSIDKNIKRFIESEDTFFVFFAIDCEKTKVFLNIGVYAKFLFEKLYLAGSNEIVVRDLIDKEIYEDVNYVKRFENLDTKGKDPYFFNKIKKYRFEADMLNIRKRLYDGNYCYDLTEATDMLEKYDESYKVPEVRSTEESYMDARLMDEYLATADDVPVHANHHYNRLLRIAQQKDLNILLVGKQYTKKTFVGKKLAVLLDIDFVNVDLVVEEFITGYSEENEVTEEKQTNEEGDEIEPKLVYSENYRQMKQLKTGKVLTNEFIVGKIVEKLKTIKKAGRSYILEVSSNIYSYSDIERLVNFNPQTASCFNYILELKISDDDVLNRGRGVTEYLVLNEQEEQVVLRINESEMKEIELRVKRAEYLTGEDESIQQLVQMIQDELREDLVGFKSPVDKDQVKAQTRAVVSKEAGETIRKYKKEVNQFVNDYIFMEGAECYSLDVSSLPKFDVISRLLVSFKRSKQVYPRVIEGASNFSDLLKFEKNEEEFDIINRWSFYREIDSIEFMERQRIEKGSPEFAVEYFNFVFVFASEENRNKFCLEPKKYIKDAPMLVSQINVSVLCPHFAGLDDLIQAVNSSYKFTMIDPIKFVTELFSRIDEELAAAEPPQEPTAEVMQKETIFGYFDRFGINILQCRDRLYSGEGLTIKDLLRLLYYSVGGEMESKMDEEAELEKLRDMADKNPKKKKPVKKKLKVIALADLVPVEHNQAIRTEYYERLLDEELDFDKVVIEKQLAVMKIDKHELNLKGFMFINMPYSAADIDEFKIFGFDIDKVIYLYGEELAEDEGFIHETQTHLSLQEDLAQQTELLAQLEEKFGEEKLFKLLYKSSKDLPYFNLKLKDIIDPFKQKLDGEVTYRDADYEIADTREKVARFGFGEYCPVNLSNNNWFTKGNYEHNYQIDNEAVFFVNEDNKLRFEERYEDYLTWALNRDFVRFVDENKRVFLSGAAGSGLRTTTAYLKERYGLTVVSLKHLLLKQKEDFIKTYVEDKGLRKPFEPEAQPNEDEVVDILDSYDIDPEENEKIEKQMIEKLFLHHNNCVYVFDMFLDERQARVFKSNVLEIMKERGLLPDHFIWLKSTEKTVLARLLNIDQLKQTHKKQISDYETLKRKIIEERRKELFEAMADEEKEEIGGYENIEVDDKDVDIEEPAPLEELVEKEKEKIVETRTQHLSVIEEIVSTLEELKIPVRQVSTESDLEKIKARVCSVVEGIMVERKSAFELGRVAFVIDSEVEDLSVEHKIRKMVQSGSYQLSKYGLFNYLKPYEPVKTLDHNFVYKNEIFFVGSNEELNMIKADTGLLGRKEIFDPKFNNTLVYFFDQIEDPQLRANIETEFQTNVVSLQQVYKAFLEEDVMARFGRYEMSDFNWYFSNINYLEYVKLNEIQKLNLYDAKSAEIRQTLSKGVDLTNEQKIEALIIWLKTYDYQNKPLVIDKFPENDEQRRMMHERGLVPDFVVDKIGAGVLEGRPKETEKNDLRYFYSLNYDNIYTLNLDKSPEANTEIIKKLAGSYKNNLKNVVNARSINAVHCLNHIKCSRRFINERLSARRFMDRALFHQTSKFSVLRFHRLFAYSYRDIVYFLLANSDTSEQILTDVDSVSLADKQVLPQIQVSRVYCKVDHPNLTATQYQSNCPVSLSMNKFDDGHNFFHLVFKDKRFNFKDFNNFRQFFAAPMVYSYQRFDPDRLAQHLEIKYKQRTEKEILIDEVTFALNQVCKAKPKHFKISLKETVLKLFALYMKSRDSYKNETYRQKYVKLLEVFIQDCVIVDRLNLECGNADYWSHDQKEAFLNESDRLFRNIDSIGIDKRGYFGMFIN